MKKSSTPPLTRTPIVLIFLLAPLLLHAWGMQGHRVVGGIADHYLNAKASNEIRKILGNESMAMASNWGDFIKSDRSYEYISPWHYVNFPGGLSSVQFYDRLKKDTAASLYNKTQFIVSALRKPDLTKQQKVFYLKLLIHFVGDAHQPMHVGRPGDRGGNNIKLYWFNAPSNLHRVWDEHLVEYQQLSYTEHVSAINFVTAAQKRKWQTDPMSLWFYESYQIAENLYKGVKPEDKLGYNYNFQHVETMNRQLLKAGVRLAGTLNDIFGR